MGNGASPFTGLFLALGRALVSGGGSDRRGVASAPRGSRSFAGLDGRPPPNPGDRVSGRAVKALRDSCRCDGRRRVRRVPGAGPEE